jgi:hypothetical protein
MKIGKSSSPKKSAGHIEFTPDGSVEFFQIGDDVYAAPTYLPLADANGTRRHGRWESSRNHFDRYHSVIVGLPDPKSIGAPVTEPSSENPLRRGSDGARLRGASLAAAESAAAACSIGKPKAAGRADESRRRTAIQDLKDHWGRALKAERATDALAELEHAALAAREATGSDQYEKRAIEIVSGGKPR